jgi:hypothetical protein
VDFVNIPIDGAKFSSDTTIYWYGTDVDGYIKYFKYAVVEESLIVSDPIDYIETTPEDSVPWVTLTVTLDDTQTKEKIKMSANVKDPVRNYKSSYIFLTAVDNDGAMAWPPVYRKFYKNNHFPDTKLATNFIYLPYINDTAYGLSLLEGVTANFTGFDKIDYPQNPPAFNFHWKIFGPYDSLEMVKINNDYVDSVFLDKYGDIHNIGDSTVELTIDTSFTVDTTITIDPPDTLIDTTDTVIDTTFIITRYNPKVDLSDLGVWNQFIKIDSFSSDLNRMIEESNNPLTGSNWTTDTKANIYDVFRNQNLSPEADTTMKMYFVIWCKAQDDSQVEDPVPAFNWISVIDPKSERDVIVLDFSNYGGYNWPKMPNISWGGTLTPSDWPTVVKDVYGRLINNWKPGSFDTSNYLPNVHLSFKDGTSQDIEYSKYKCTQDYFAINALGLPPAPETGVNFVSLRDILKHKIILIIKDSPGSGLSFSATTYIPVEQFVLQGISAGRRVWSMMRTPFLNSIEAYPQMLEMPIEFMSTFSIAKIYYTSWGGFIAYNPGNQDWLRFYGREYGELGQIRIEDCIGANSILPNVLPDLKVDTNLLEDRYVWREGFGILQYPFRWPYDGSMIAGAYPEVGYIEKFYGAEALYVYNSKHGKSQPVFPIPYETHGNNSLRVGFTEESDGKVVAVRLDAMPYFRTSHFSFTFIPMDSTSIQPAFNEMMDWLAINLYPTANKPSAVHAPGFDANRFKRMIRESNETINQEIMNRLQNKTY